jgi:hypothetical protein
MPRPRFETAVGPRACAAALALSAAALCPSAAGAAGSEAAEILAHQPEALVERLFEDKEVVLQKVKTGPALPDDFFVAFVLFDVPVENAYRMLAQTSRQVEFRPDVRSIETVARPASGPVDEHRLRILFLDVRYRLRYQMDPAHHTMRWDLDPSFDNSLARVEGFWELYPLDAERTLARFGAVVDVGPALPRSLESWVTRKNLPRTIDRARRWVDSGGRYRP